MVERREGWPMNQYDDSREAPTERNPAGPYPDTAAVPVQWPERRPGGRISLLLVAIAALVGAWLAATSAHDFAQHLDGQVHALTCSVMPGADATLGASGCKDAMLSPYSSIWRTRIWGGVPVALGGLAVFAFLAALAAAMAFAPDRSRRDTGYLLLAATLPLVSSIVFAWLSSEKVGSFCTVCVGMYSASAAVWVLSLIALLRTSPGQGVWPWGRMALWTLEGVAFVGVLTWMWMAYAPAERPSVETGCGTLVAPDKAGVLVPLTEHPGGVRSLLALDPLCPACRGFDQRLSQSGLDKQLSIDLLLFPLDASCNWMVKDSLHPGACALSEAIFCAPEKARDVLSWAFGEQRRLLELGKRDEAALRREVVARFPALGGCVGSAKAKARVNKALRFAVANALPVLTPQLFVDGVRLCDEDTDLGLEYTLTRLLAAARAGPAEARGTAPATPEGGRP